MPVGLFFRDENAFIDQLFARVWFFAMKTQIFVFSEEFQTIPSGHPMFLGSQAASSHLSTAGSLELPTCLREQIASRWQNTTRFKLNKLNKLNQPRRLRQRHLDTQRLTQSHVQDDSVNIWMNKIIAKLFALLGCAILLARFFASSAVPRVWVRAIRLQLGDGKPGFQT